MNIKNTIKKTVCMTTAAMTIFGVCGAYAQKITTQQIDDLKVYNIMVGDAESGDLRLGDNITRAEAAKVLCTAVSLDTSVPQDVSRCYTRPLGV